MPVEKARQPGSAFDTCEPRGKSRVSAFRPNPTVSLMRGPSQHPNRPRVECLGAHDRRVVDRTRRRIDLGRSTRQLRTSRSHRNWWAVAHPERAGPALAVSLLVRRHRGRGL